MFGGMGFGPAELHEVLTTTATQAHKHTWAATTGESLGNQSTRRRCSSRT